MIKEILLAVIMLSVIFILSSGMTIQFPYIFFPTLLRPRTHIDDNRIYVMLRFFLFQGP